MIEQEHETQSNPAHDPGLGLSGIWVLDILEGGFLEDRDVFVDLEGGGPDDMNVDTGGNLSVAAKNPSEQAFHIYSPKGELSCRQTLAGEGETKLERFTGP